MIGTQRLLRAVPFLAADLIAVVDLHHWRSPNDYKASIHQRYLLEDLLHHPTAQKVCLLAPAYQCDALDALRKEITTFYDDFLATCEAGQYPPYVRLVKVSFLHPQEKTAIALGEALILRLASLHRITALGPLVTPHTRPGKKKAEIWVKTRSQASKKLLVETIQSLTQTQPYRKVQVSLDVDPLF